MNIAYAWTNVNGTRLYYEKAGSGDAVILLHGFSLDVRMWDDQFLSLAQDFQVIRYDLRGFGKSALPTDEPYSHVADLKALMDSLGIQQAHLVGLSKGGAVATDFALTHPQQTRSLVLIDTVLGGFSWSTESTERNRAVWQRARERGISAAKESWLAHPLFEPAHQQLTVASRLEAIVGDYSGWHFVTENPEQRLDPPAAQRLQELQMPVLVIVGEHDMRDFLQIADVICQQLPQATKLTVPGVGHMANMEAPTQVTDAMLAFLKGV